MNIEAEIILIAFLLLSTFGQNHKNGQIILIGTKCPHGHQCHE